MKSGDTSQLYPNVVMEVLPDEEAYKGLVWLSDRSDIVEVSQDGRITAKDEGTAFITARSAMDPSKTAVCRVSVGVNVRSVSIDQPSLSVRYGQTSQLSATVDVSPDKPEYKSVEWAAGDGKVSVDADGVVTALALGQSTVSAVSSVDSSKQSVCPVNVLPFVSSVSFDAGELSLKVGQGADLVASVSVLPASAPSESRRVSYDSSDENVAYVNSNGRITACGVGTTQITATSIEDPLAAPALCTVSVGPAVSVAIASHALELHAGDVHVMGCSVESNPQTNPDGSSNLLATWSSSDSDVLGVDQSGALEAKYPGTATITLTSFADASVSDSCVVTVLPSFEEAIGLSAYALSLSPEDEFGLEVTSAFSNPDEPPYNAVTYDSSDKSVATVSQDGVVTAVADGECVITVASAFNPSLYAQCSVEVSSGPRYVKFESGISFSIWTSRQTEWDGLLEASSDGIEWVQYPATANYDEEGNLTSYTVATSTNLITSALNEETGLYEVYLRGKGQHLCQKWIVAEWHQN